MLEDHIQELANAGSIDSSGQVEIDLSTAMEKLAYGLHHEPQVVLTKICAGLISLGGEEIWIRNLRRGVLVAVKSPQKDWWPASIAELALGKMGPGLKPLGLAMLALRPHLQNMGWIRWGDTTEVLPLAPGALRAPKNPWKNCPAAGLWLEGKPDGFGLGEAYHKVSQRLYHSPVIVRWNGYILGLASWESMQEKVESEYVCLDPHPDGQLGARPRTTVTQECWGSLPYIPVKSGEANAPRGSLRWVETNRELSPQTGKGWIYHPRLVFKHNYRFHTGSLVVCLHEGPSRIYPIHHGEGLESVGIDNENFPELQTGVTVFAPADNLTTNVTHSCLLEDERFRVWREQLLQRVAGAVRRISEADAEMNKVKDSRARLCWFYLRRRLSLSTDQKSERSEESWEGCMAGLFGLSAQRVLAHNQPISLQHWIHGPPKDRLLSIWIEPNRDLSELWEALEQARLPASPSNPIYDLVRFCLKPPNAVQAIRLVEWSGGQEMHSWCRDELKIFQVAPQPVCKNGLLLHALEDTHGLFKLDLMRFRLGGHPNDGIRLWDWKNSRQDPASVRLASQKMFEGFLRWTWKRFPYRPSADFVPIISCAFPPRGQEVGFWFAVEPNLCYFQGQLHKEGALHCGLECNPDFKRYENFIHLQLYRFGLCVSRTLWEVEGFPEIGQIAVDATDWDLSEHSWERHFRQHRWFDLLHAANEQLRKVRTK